MICYYYKINSSCLINLVSFSHCKLLLQLTAHTAIYTPLHEPLASPLAITLHAIQHRYLLFAMIVSFALFWKLCRFSFLNCYMCATATQLDLNEGQENRYRYDVWCDCTCQHDCNGKLVGDHKHESSCVHYNSSLWKPLWLSWFVGLLNSTQLRKENPSESWLQFLLDVLYKRFFGLCFGNHEWIPVVARELQKKKNQQSCWYKLIE